MSSSKADNPPAPLLVPEDALELAELEEALLALEEEELELELEDELLELEALELEDEPPTTPV